MIQPISKFYFEVNWKGIKIRFSEIKGLGNVTKLIEYRAKKPLGTLDTAAQQKQSTIILKRGLVKGDKAFYKALHKKDKVNLTITLFDERYLPVVVWKIKKALPVKVQAADLKADANEIAIESIELTHEGITMEKNW